MPSRSWQRELHRLQDGRCDVPHRGTHPQAYGLAPSRRPSNSSRVHRHSSCRVAQGRPLAYSQRAGDYLHTKYRLNGYKKALQKNNIDFDESVVVYENWKRDGGVSGTNKLFSTNKKFDAIFCFNDLMAAGCYDVLAEKNIVPGKDSSVVGFDNQTVCEYLKPNLTTMAISLSEIGYEAAKMLLDENFQDKLIPCKMILRDSI